MSWSCFSQAVPFKQAILKYNPPVPATKVEGKAALPLGRAQAAGGARQGWTPGVPRQADRDLGALAAQLCSKSDILRLCEHERVGGGTGGEVEVVQRSGTRAVAQASLMWALEGVACQSFWQKKKLLQMATASRERTAKTEEFMTEIMERKRKKAFPMYPFRLFS